MTTVQVAVSTAAKHFAPLNDASQEIYFMCTPFKMWRQIEILPVNWAAFSSFNFTEVRKRPNTRAVREQVAGSGPRQQPPPPPAGVGWWTAQVDSILIILSSVVRLAYPDFFGYWDIRLI